MYQSFVSLVNRVIQEDPLSECLTFRGGCRLLHWNLTGPEA